MKSWLGFILCCLVFFVNQGSSFFGDNVKLNSCPIVFIISKGVLPLKDQTNLDSGVSLYASKKYSDPWKDEDGKGTKANVILSKKFTNCATFVPIKVDNSTDSEIVNRFTLQHCLRKRRGKMCINYSAFSDREFDLTLPIAKNMAQLQNYLERIKITMKINKNGKIEKEYAYHTDLRKST